MCEHRTRRARPTNRRGAGGRRGHDWTDRLRAKSFGIYGEGPILDPEEIRPALARGLTVVKEKRRPALIDTVTQSR